MKELIANYWRGEKFAVCRTLRLLTCHFSWWVEMAAGQFFLSVVASSFLIDGHYRGGNKKQ